MPKEEKNITLHSEAPSPCGESDGRGVYIQNVSSISPQNTFETDDFLFQPTAIEKETEYLSAVEPDYKEYITDAGIRRRMSRIVKMGVAAALSCVRNSSVENPDAIITATGLGCLADTEKFLNNIVTQEEKLLNPTSFIQSTFNTIGAQIALILKNRNYNFTYVHRGFSFETALLDAIMQLKDKEAENVLVGAMDEITPSSYNIMKRMGFWRNETKMGEGAQFFMLSASSSDKDFAKLKDVSTFLLHDNNELEKIITNFLIKNDVSLQDIDLILFGETGDSKQDIYFSELKNGILKDIPSVRFKHLCGEYQTASSFALWCASNILKKDEMPSVLGERKSPREIKKILIYNVYRKRNHSLFLLEKV